ncbi:MAG: AAA family ATPase [Gammaproteobacteria bacterium]|nr:AAA family ATPase [Gammaproteobacteria bacterium]
MSQYTSQLKLRFDPFDTSIESSDFYGGGKRQQLLDQLIELSCYSSDITVVTGPLGSGKTTISNGLARSLDNDFIAVCVQASLFMDAAQLLETICRNLNIEVSQQSTTHELSNSISNYAGFMADQSKTVQLIVDDAHELGSEALEAIVEVVKRQADAAVLGESGLKVVLFGEDQLLNSLGQLPLESGVRFELEPFTREEAVDYVRYKLSIAGYNGEFPIDIATMEKICDRSMGVPGAISPLVREELDKLDFGSNMIPAFNFPERHLVAGSVLFSVLLIALFFLVGDESEVTLENQVAGTGSQGASQNRIQIPLDVATSLPQEAQGTANSQVFRQQDIDVERDGAEVISEAEERQQSVREVVAATEIPVIEAAGETDEDPAIPAIESPATEESSVVKEVTVEAAREVVKEEPVETLLSQTEHPLLAYPSDSFTLQLLGSRSETSVKNFISDNDGGASYTYFETRYREQPWFVVVYGSYPDRSAATAAIPQLPGSLSDLKPWARNISEIQQDIRKYPQ